MTDGTWNALVEELDTGAQFRVGPYGETLTVARTTWSVDGSVAYVRLADGTTKILPRLLRCFVYTPAPRCACGYVYEDCEMDCEWPEYIEDLFMTH